MTTDYPPGTTPTGPNNLPPDDDAAWGCLWWWWLVIIIIILIIWWAGWGWGTSGGYWFRQRPITPVPTVAPGTPIAPVTPPPAAGRSATTEPTTR